MSIEEIEKFLAKVLPAFADNEDTPSDTILATVQVQLLLHIYHKLEALEQQPTPPNPPRISYSQRVY